MPKHDEGFFTAHDGLRLFWASDVPEAPRAHVARVHGYGDHGGRYRDAIDALNADGFAVHGFDYRGHGRADGKRGYAQKWGDYLEDLERFWGRARQAADGKPLFLLAHSHGGLMSVHALAHGRLPGVAGVILSAPYLKLAITPPPLKVLGARLVGKLIPWMPVPSELKLEDLSTDPEWVRKTGADPLYIRTVTPRWFIESTKAQAEAMALAPRLTQPLLHFCGADDGVASVEASRQFFERVGAADKRFKTYPNMRHESLCELGRAEVFRDISGWISSHL
jgi:lysophospholipase